MAKDIQTIAVNTRWLLPNKLEGMGWFTHHLLKRMVVNHPEVQFIFIFDRPWDPDFIYGPNVTPIIVGPQARHPILWRLWSQMSVRRVLNKHQPDVFLSPDGFIPLQSKTPSIAVIHDLNFEHFPNWSPKRVTAFYKKYMPKFAEQATHIATVSEFTKSDISRLYKVNPEKISVVYNGPQSSLRGLTDVEKSTFRKNKTQEEPYFLFLGALNPRKNLERVFQAFDRFKEKTGLSHKLVVVGQTMYWPAKTKNLFEKLTHKDDIIFTGRCEDAMINAWLGAAEALFFPSLFEGFGIPIVEAFYAETPVITSNTSAMPEIAGNAALLVEPNSIDELTQSLITLAQDEDLRKGLIEKGKKRKELFSWDLEEKKLWALIQNTIHESKSTT